MSDYISRADAICEVLVNDGIDNIVNRINALPSANVIKFDFNKYQPRARNKVNDGTLLVEAVQGEWQKVEEQPYFRKHYDTVCCSVCRKKGNRKWNFCPSCGARMKGGAE